MQLPWAQRPPMAVDDKPGQQPVAETQKTEALHEERKPKGFPKLKPKTIKTKHKQG